MCPCSHLSSLRSPLVLRQRRSSLKKSMNPSTLTTSRNTYKIEGLWAAEYRPVSSSRAVSSIRSKLDSKIFNEAQWYVWEKGLVRWGKACALD